MTHDAYARACRCLALLPLFFFLAACNKEAPKVNTPEYRAAHGITEGQPNTIQVASSTFRVPADVVFDVYTADTIQTAKADVLTLHLNMGLLFTPPRTGPAGKGEQHMIRTEISARGNPARMESMLSFEKTDAPVERTDLDLIEYPVIAPSSTDFSRNYIYQSRESDNTTPPTEFFCRVVWLNDPSRKNGTCRTSFYNQSGLLIQSFFSYDLLKDWKSITKEVRNKIDGYAEVLSLRE
ncbi:hypothetical protein [Pseudomonas capsici]|uniref:Lipoprotein n=1 Tax=Pseudomonas capsici TaxID=2810614 RepID=A0ABT3C2Q4_9PSED|nr:hypothetical protein [Pseudomonas capsici]MCV4270313.1 hypothetical protein [Pseudomonas capsici]MCV4280597.1 hypothetical protein [Pseudomonas capsici]MCV4333838.1 hypothetical protein [Pseudomonas capsici]MCV4379353.1 hypothetical protein [Pseudomonas capsici]